mgnify:CR=1 FL=1
MAERKTIKEKKTTASIITIIILRISNLNSESDSEGQISESR